LSGLRQGIMAVKSNILGVFSPDQLGTAFSALTENIQKIFKKKQNQVDIKVINIVLLLCVIILSVYFVYSLSQGIKKINPGKWVAPELAKDAKVRKETPRLKDLAYYIGKTQSRDIFKMGVSSSSSVNEVISSKAAEVMQNLRLVGISWSDNPDIMIEDVKSARTSFVKKGQMVGDLKVESVFKDKIILRYGEELIELR
jgi:TATA-box binding protein (TBP) (component of TFIID and TFIIIB)